ncbi:sensor histidine kinase [Thalassomonas actiniarum]|uniref:histidine kinase n=1 Tax=Thalassomonas actiniarum TaxID=485447 RepID=A0AAF0C4D6_9GAMM|nr:sensor histidine kinase [Thalassomonas actiniarum]WDD99833.1 GHKL domain-containing protein [Thalassomonas actiniarum]
MRISAKLLIIGFLLTSQLALVATGYAARQTFSAITTGQGLSDNNINAIIQDDYGFLWIATESGLNRYDGREIVSYSRGKEHPGLSDDELVTMYLGEDNILWIGSENGGLIRFDIGKGSFSHISQAFSQDGRLLLDGRHLSSNTVHAITQQDGLLYIGTEGGGLNIMDLATGEISYYFVDRSLVKNPENTLCHNEIKTMLRDSLGFIWMGTVDGLNKYDPRQKSLLCFRNQANNKRSLANNEVVSIVEDGQQNLWLGTEGGGVNHFHRESGRFTRYQHREKDNHSLSNDEVQALYLTRDNALWVATEHGLNRFDADKGTFSRFFYQGGMNGSLSSNVISALYQDKAGILWVGTEGGGLNKAHPSKFAMDPRGRYPGARWQGQAITAIYKPSQDITWVGTENLGLWTFDAATGTYQHYLCLLRECEPGASEITAIAGDERALWLGTDGQGLLRYSLKEQSFTQVSLPFEDYISVTSLILGRDNQLWIGTEENTLFKLNTLTLKSQVIPLTPLTRLKAEFGNEVRCLLEDSRGNLWLGTEEFGVIFIDRQNQAMVHYYHEVKSHEVKGTGTEEPGVNENLNISNNVINAIKEDAYGRIWIATALGLNLVDTANGRLSKYFIRDGLLSNNLMDIIVDEFDDLWLSTNKGLMRYQLRTERFSHYDIGDGLVNEQYARGAAYKDSRGLLYFGGSTGIDVIDPQRVPKNPHAPRTMITKLSLFDQEVVAGEGVLQRPVYAADELYLSHKNYVFSLQFSALDFTAPEKNQYAFYLAGFDENWRYVAQQNSATYTNLPAGDYTFYVKGTNNDGVWSQPPAQLAITIAAAPWKTWWAYSGYTLLLLFIIYLFLTVKLKRQRDAFALLREREEKQRLKDNYEMEQRFTSNVAHELKTPLAELISMSEIALRWPDDPKVTQDFFQDTLDAANQMHQVVNNLLALARCERGLIKLKYTPLHLAEEIHHAWSRYRNEWQAKNIPLHLDKNSPYIINSSQAEFTLILNNILSNAIEYSPQGSDIRVEIKQQDNGAYAVSFANAMEDPLEPEELELMFQRLWRKDLSRSSEKHSGLGMSLIKAYAGLFGYQLSVEIGQDGCFMLTLKEIQAYRL